MKEQLFIAGTEPADEPRIPAIATAIDRWLDAKEKQARSSETAKIRHENLLAELESHGLERYPFIDERTGRKRYVVADKTPRAKTVNAPQRKTEFEERAPRKRRDKSDEVEQRKVPRAEAVAEINARTAADRAADDPNAEVEAAMESSWRPAKSLLEQAEESQDGEDESGGVAPEKAAAAPKNTKPKKRKGK